MFASTVTATVYPIRAGEASPTCGGIAVAPPRLNFAGRCIMCSASGCTDADCIEMYDATQWQVCTLCDGIGWKNYVPCLCTFGLIEVGR